MSLTVDVLTSGIRINLEYRVAECERTDGVQ